MNFATPIPDMSNRPRKKRAAGGGRPKNGDKERIPAIAWFNFVAQGLGVKATGTIARLMQAEADARPGSQDQLEAKCWYGYEAGRTPSPNQLNFVNEVVPNSATVFLDGPGDLWMALWSDFAPRFYEDEVATLLSISPSQIDATWLAKAVVCWRNRAAVMRLGSFENMIDGLYEAVFIGLGHQEEVLRKLGVWELVCENIRDTERTNLRADPHKHLEIEAAGGPHFSDPVEFYLSNPLEFSRIVMEGAAYKNERACEDALAQ